MLAPGQSKQTDVEFRTVSRAILPIGPLRIRKGDPFGLVRHEKELADRITVFIHPRTVRLDTLNAGVPRDLEGQPSGQIVMMISTSTDCANTSRATTCVTSTG